LFFQLNIFIFNVNFFFQLELIFLVHVTLMYIVIGTHHYVTRLHHLIHAKNNVHKAKAHRFAGYAKMGKTVPRSLPQIPKTHACQALSAYFPTEPWLPIFQPPNVIPMENARTHVRQNVKVRK
jgi:hypothetical protein